jgi:hypothetical protein
MHKPGKHGQEVGMRNRVLVCGPTIACLGALAISTATAAAQSQPATVSKTGVVATVSATGCIERWAPQAGDTNVKAPDGVQFVLTGIDGKTVSATSADGAPGKTPSAARYLLLSQPSHNVAAHLNHRVKIEGTIAPQPTEGASLADNLSNPASRETNLPEGPESKSYRDNVVDVSSVTMIAKSCGQK